MGDFSKLMSSAAHRFGHVEFWKSNICCCFLQAGAVEKIKTNIQTSTRQNQWAAEDIRTKLESKDQNLKFACQLRAQIFRFYGLIKS